MPIYFSVFLGKVELLCVAILAMSKASKEGKCEHGRCFQSLALSPALR